MKRRKALATIVWGTGALAALPYCTTNPYAIFDHLPFSLEEMEAIIALSKDMVPEYTDSFPTPEERAIFLLRMLNDLLTPQEQQTFAEGVKAFLKENPSFFKLSISEKESILMAGLAAENSALLTIKRFSLRHLMTTQAYMENIQQYEFIPGRYDGCVAVN